MTQKRKTMDERVDLQKIKEAEAAYREEHHAKTSPAFEALLHEFYFTSALLDSLNMARTLITDLKADIEKGETYPSTTVTEKEPPPNALSAALTSKTTQAKGFASLFHEFEEALNNKNFDKAASTLIKLSTLLLSTPASQLPPQFLNKLSESLSSLLSHEMAQKSCSELLLFSFMLQMIDKGKKEKLSLEAIKAKLLATLNARADLTKMPFADGATRLLEDPEALLDELLKGSPSALSDIKEKIASLLKEASTQPDVKLSLIATGKMFEKELSKSNRYATYLNALSEEAEVGSVKPTLVDTMKQQIEALTKELRSLTSVDSRFATLITNLTTALKRGVPLSEENYSLLKTTLKQVYDLISEKIKTTPFPLDLQEKLISGHLKMIQTSLRQIEEGQKGCSNQINQLTAERKDALDAKAAVDQLNEILREMAETGKSSYVQFQALANQLFSLFDHIQNNPNLSSSFKDLFGAFSDISINGKSFASLVASGTLSINFKEFAKKAEGKSLKEFLSLIDEKLGNLKRIKGSHPFLEDLYYSLQQYTQDPTFPALASAFDLPFAKEEGGLLVPNSAMPDAIEKGASLDKASLGNALNGANAASNQLDNKAEEANAKATGVSNGANRLSNVQSGYQAAENDAILKDPAAKSLTEEFIHVLLDIFMPGQEATLDKLAANLKMLNIGSQEFTRLLDDFVSIEGAPQILNVLNQLVSLVKPNPDGSFDLTMFQSYKDQLKNAQQTIDSLANTIHDLLTETTDKDGKIIPSPLQKMIDEVTKSRDDYIADAKSKGRDPDAEVLLQYNEMIGNLKNVGTDLQAMQPGISALSNAYKGLVIEKIGYPPTGFQVGTIDAMGAFHPITDFTPYTQKELAVINGDPNAVPPIKGLKDFLSQDIRQFTNLYSGQSQTAMIMCQAQMTTINQEWTIIATCMQILNQATHEVAASISQA